MTRKKVSSSQQQKWFLFCPRWSQGYLKRLAFSPLLLTANHSCHVRKQIVFLKCYTPLCLDHITWPYSKQLKLHSQLARMLIVEMKSICVWSLSYYIYLNRSIYSLFSLCWCYLVAKHSNLFSLLFFFSSIHQNHNKKANFEVLQFLFWVSWKIHHITVGEWQGGIKGLFMQLKKL